VEVCLLWSTARFPTFHNAMMISGTTPLADIFILREVTFHLMARGRQVPSSKPTFSPTLDSSKKHPGQEKFTHLQFLAIRACAGTNPSGSQIVAHKASGVSEKVRIGAVPCIKASAL